MPTIFVHHHAEDLLAGEVIAGALVSLGQVALVSYPPGPQVVVETPLGGRVENLVMWTEDAAEEASMALLLRGLAVRRAHCTLLLQQAVTAPDDLIRCDCWPLFDRSTPWVGYRRALRSLFGDTGRETRETRTAPPVRVRASVLDHIAETLPAARLPGWLSEYPILPNLVLGGILLWALLR